MKRKPIVAVLFVIVISIFMRGCGNQKKSDEDKKLEPATTESELVIEEMIKTEEVIDTEVIVNTEEDVTSESAPLETDSIKDTQENLELAEQDWVADLKIAQTSNQLIVVAANGKYATVTMHNKNESGLWEEILSTEASIGRNGIGKTSEGDGKTPQGQYAFTFAFGIKPNPGTRLSYTQVDESCYWVDDSNSNYYNQFVSLNQVEKDWNSAEHILKAGRSYNYVLATNYNEDCVPGAGSAIFMHCKPTGGAGCIAVSEEAMIFILHNIQPGCVLLIDSTTGVYNY